MKMRVKQLEVDGQNPIGTGPFRLAGHEQGIWIWRHSLRIFRAEASWIVLKCGHCRRMNNGLSDPKQPFQVMHNVRISDMDAQRWQQVRQSGMTTKFMTVNERKEGPLKNPLIREALNLALDRAYLLEQLSGDVIEVAIIFPEISR